MVTPDGDMVTNGGLDIGLGKEYIANTRDLQRGQRVKGNDMNAHTEKQDRYVNAAEQAQAQYESIKEMVEALRRADESAWDSPPEPFGNFDDANESARCTIRADASSVEVRSGWYSPGQDQPAPEEYRILLCTGGPAVQIVGEMSEHGEPKTARLEMQDWFLPWAEYRPIDESVKTSATRIDTKAEETLLAYARCFYFGD
jgi:hypothetical protein